MLGDLTRDDVLALVPEVASLSQLDPKLDALLNAADEIQQQWTGSYVEIVVHIPDSPYHGGEISDNHRLYSVRLETRR